MRGVARSCSYAETADVSMISSEVLWEPQQVSGVGIFAMTNEIHPAINKNKVQSTRRPSGSAAVERVRSTLYELVFWQTGRLSKVPRPERLLCHPYPRPLERPKKPDGLGACLINGNPPLCVPTHYRGEPQVRSAKVGLGTVTQERARFSLSEFYLFISFIICPLFLMFLPTGGVACSSGLRNYCTIEQGPLCCERGISSRLSSQVPFASWLLCM